VRLIYKPHPKVVTSQAPTIRKAHHDLVAMVAHAARVDPDAGHDSVLEGDILAVMPDCDAMVTDVSSVGLDWLYLCTDKPLFLTDRHQDAERLRREIPVSRCADVIEHVDVAGLAGLIAARHENDEHHLARVAMRHHYFDALQVGESTARFLDAVSELVALRDRLIGDASGSGEERTA
jgi:CDP-glycerol glycerophosphotransferase (TagB/SpsB family)